MRVETYYGQETEKRDPYMTRVSFTESHILHVFHRGDSDEDPHDHRRAFITFPLVSYVEEIYRPGEHFDGVGMTRRVVKAWRPHFRGRTFTHRLLGAWSGARDHLTGRPEPTIAEGHVVTLVWWLGRKRATWGFWCPPADGLWVRRGFVAWDDYILRGVRRHGSKHA